MPQPDPNADYYIKALNLSPHPEGGYYTRVYEAPERITAALPERFGGARPFSTSIYFLLAGQQVSHFHRIAADELWHFYAGSGLTIHVITATGEHQDLQLGADIAAAEAFQHCVPAGNWFGASLKDTTSFALVGCTVAPGFHFDDFELATRAGLLNLYPQHADLIKRLTPAV